MNALECNSKLPQAGDPSQDPLANGDAVRASAWAKAVVVFTTATDENLTWFEANQADLSSRYPEWKNQYVIVASRTPSKIVALDADRSVALEKGLRCPEVLTLAEHEGAPPGSLVTALLLGPARYLADL